MADRLNSVYRCSNALFCGLKEITTIPLGVMVSGSTFDPPAVQWGVGGVR